MITVNHAGSRGVLLAGMILCFLPLTLAWAACIADLWQGWPATLLLSVGALLGVAGPIGLISAFRSILLNQRIARWLTLSLIVSSVSLVALSVIAFASEDTFVQVLRDAMLIGILPALGSAYMLVSSERATRASRA